MDMYKRAEKSSSSLYCFTPLVSLGTFIIEAVFSLYVLFKYRSTLMSRLCFALLACLGIFQLSEYLVCTISNGEKWIYLGFIAITFLPALGLHISTLIVKRQTNILWLSYSAVALIVGLLLLTPLYNLHAQCMTNYVNVTMNFPYGLLFGIFYMYFMFYAIYFTYKHSRKPLGTKSVELWLILSYLVFIVPSALLYFARIIVKSSLPSVMCGFALLTAIIFIMKIIPLYYKRNK